MQPRDVLEGWEDLKEALSLTQGGAVFFVVADDKGDARIKERLRSAGWELVEEEIAVWLDPPLESRRIECRNTMPCNASWQDAAMLCCG